MHAVSDTILIHIQLSCRHQVHVIFPTLSSFGVPISKENQTTHNSQLPSPQARANLLVSMSRSFEREIVFQERQPLHRLAPTGFTERQKRKVASGDRPRHEVGAREAAVALRLVEVRKGAVSARLIEPLGHAFQNLGADGFAGDGGGEEFPVGLGVEVAAVEGQAVGLADGVVPVRLDLVDLVGDEAGAV